MLVRVRPDTGGMHTWVSADAFEQFFPEISADEARRQLGPDGEERVLDQAATREFIAGLERLLHGPLPWQGVTGQTSGCRDPVPVRGWYDDRTLQLTGRLSGRGASCSSGRVSALNPPTIHAPRDPLCSRRVPPMRTCSGCA
jgi:hypothetical protein